MRSCSVRCVTGRVFIDLKFVRRFVVLFSVLLPVAAVAELDDKQRFEQAMEIYGDPSVEIPRVLLPVTIDGRLAEAAWREAARVDVAWQVSPVSNVPSTVQTTALIMDDGETLYVAFDARDPEPHLIRAFLRKRDTLFSDDYVAVGIDTGGDGARAFEFFANPLGVQADALTSQQSGEDFSFDAIFETAGQITGQGYEVEFAIPLNQIRFSPSDGPQHWKLLFTRTHWRDQRYQAMQYPRDRENDCFVCQFQPASGLVGIVPGRRFQFIPSLTADSRRTSDPLRQTSDNHEDEFELGIADFRWGITPDVTFNATVNPDFSQIEADIAQSAVNTPQVLFFPERRPFFLEGRDLFATQTKLVNTRNVSDPQYGAKITGKVGENVYGLLVAQDRVSNFIVADSEGSTTSQLDQEHRATIARYRRDFADSSHIGVIATQRQGDGYENQVLSLDGRYRLTSADTLQAQVSQSWADNPAQLVDEFGFEESADDTAYQLGYNHHGREWFWGFAHTDVGTDFQADSGFINRRDFHFSNANLGYQFNGQPDDFISHANFGFEVGEAAANASGDLLWRGGGFFANLSLPRDTWLTLTYLNQDQTHQGRKFSIVQKSLGLRTRPLNGFSYSARVRFGDRIDFVNVKPGEQFLLSQKLEYNVNEHILLRLNHTYQTLDVPGGELFNSNLTDLRVTYQFNLASALLVSLIHRDTRRDPSLYLDAIDARSERLDGQVLYSYQFNTQSVFFAGYSSAGIGQDAYSGLHQESEALFVKFTYAWRL